MAFEFSPPYPCVHYHTWHMGEGVRRGLVGGKDVGGIFFMGSLLKDNLEATEYRAQ